MSFSVNRSEKRSELSHCLKTFPCFLSPQNISLSTNIPGSVLYVVLILYFDTWLFNEYTYPYIWFQEVYIYFIKNTKFGYQEFEIIRILIRPTEQLYVCRLRVGVLKTKTSRPRSGPLNVKIVH